MSKLSTLPSSIVSELNLHEWRSKLQDFDDSVVCDYLEFGWPVGYDYHSNGFPTSKLRNHKGARDFPQEVDLYLDSEIKRGAMAGPFTFVAFKSMAISPLNSVPKQDNTERRIILDLSWPMGTSVND